MSYAQRPLSCLLHMVMNGGQRTSPVSKSWANMPFSRRQRNGPLSRRTPAIDSQHLTKYASLLVKANCIYNSELTAFLKSANSSPSPCDLQGWVTWITVSSTVVCVIVTLKFDLVLIIVLTFWFYVSAILTWALKMTHSKKNMATMCDDIGTPKKKIKTPVRFKWFPQVLFVALH